MSVAFSASFGRLRDHNDAANNSQPEQLNSVVMGSSVIISLVQRASSTNIVFYL
jgi:hypothetical protein